MKFYTRSFFVFLFLVLSLNAWSQGQSLRLDEEKTEKRETALLSKTPTAAQAQRDLVLGSILKHGLETLHFSKKRVDDSLSEKAFQEYLEFLDYGKRFLLRSDVKKLSRFKKDIDNEMTAGSLELLKEANQIMDKRLKYVKNHVLSRLSKPFKLESKLAFELDSEKRNFPKTLSELKAVWDNVLLVDIINNYLDLQEEQNEDSKDKTKDKKKVDKKKTTAKKFTTPKELEQEARKRTNKKYARVFERLMREDHSDELNKFFNSIAKVFDPHTQYLPPREKKDFDISMSGSLEGIGAVLREDGSYIKVVEIIPGSASWKGQQLKPEDIILKVGQGKAEPVDIVGMRVEDAVQLIRGKKGTEVRLTVKHSSGAVEVVPIIRDVVTIEESYVKHSIIKQKKSNKKYGYIIVPQFYRDFSKGFLSKDARNCTDDVRTALKSLKKQNIDGIVLDLRNNAGGSLEDARLMSGLFIKEGPIVQVKNHEGKIDILYDNDSSVEYDGPLVVLVNKFSASASEILAGALQDYARAVIVGGEVTHGKGTVQTLLDLDRYLNPKLNLSQSLGSIKLTIQKFYRITGGSTQYKGVTPDIILPDPLGYVESGERTHKYSLPWDTVKGVKYNKWSMPNKLSTLESNSQKRVKTNKKFAKIKKSVDVLKERREDTKVRLSLANFEDRRKKSKEEAEILKYDKINEDIEVSNVSLDKKLLNKDQKERKQEWVDSLRKDPFIEETLNIIEDMSSKSLAQSK